MAAVSTTPEDAHVFETSSIMNTTLEKMAAFHEDPQAFSKLTPPPIFIQMHENNLQSLTEGDLHFTMWFGPVPVKWHAEHQPGPTAHGFTDRQVSGPLKYWRHEHIYEPVSGGVKLTDRITIAHQSGIQGLLTRLFFDGLPLRFLFFYRHLRTRMAVTK